MQNDRNSPSNSSSSSSASCPSSSDSLTASLTLSKTSIFGFDGKIVGLAFFALPFLKSLRPLFSIFCTNERRAGSSVFARSVRADLPPRRDECFSLSLLFAAFCLCFLEPCSGCFSSISFFSNTKCRRLGRDEDEKLEEFDPCKAR